MTEWGPQPEGRWEKVGIGLGHREREGRANAVRAFWGETEGGAPASAGGPNGRIAELACNLDDMTGEDLSVACDRIRAAGAVDVSLAPLLMKKGRPGHLLLALCAPERADEVAAAILRETTTLGVRRRDMARYEMDRSFVEKDVAGGVVRVKRAAGYGAAKEKPEHDDAVRAAAAAGRVRRGK